MKKIHSWAQFYLITADSLYHHINVTPAFKIHHNINKHLEQRKKKKKAGKNEVILVW